MAYVCRLWNRMWLANEQPDRDDAAYVVAETRLVVAEAAAGEGSRPRREPCGLHRTGRQARWHWTAAIVVAGAVIAAVLAGCGDGTSSAGGKIDIVAAEDEYGAMAQAIGGNQVSVTSLLTNPNTDPHEFEASTTDAITISKAQLVIENGLGYDAWMDKLLSASPHSGRVVLNVGRLLGYQTGDNPHVWYDPSGWTKEAGAIAADLSTIDPAQKAYFARQRVSWLHSLQPIDQEIAVVRKLTQGQKVIATEPVYGYMIAALGATSLDYPFQKAVMDGTDPSPQSVAQFEADLRRHTVHMLFYNSQVVDPTTTTMRQIAAQSHVPVVGVTETQPPKQSFVQWQLSQLRSIQKTWGVGRPRPQGRGLRRPPRGQPTDGMAEHPEELDVIFDYARAARHLGQRPYSSSECHSTTNPA